MTWIRIDVFLVFLEKFSEQPRHGANPTQHGAQRVLRLIVFICWGPAFFLPKQFYEITEFSQEEHSQIRNDINLSLFPIVSSMTE